MENGRNLVTMDAAVGLNDGDRVTQTEPMLSLVSWRILYVFCCRPTVHNGNPNTNNFFPGKHWDEEWFGIFRASPNPKRLPGPKVTANPAFKDQNDSTPLAERPVVSDFNGGNLNGGPDVLEPRAAVAALTELFAKEGVGNNKKKTGGLKSAPSAPDQPVRTGGAKTPGLGEFLDN